MKSDKLQIGLQIASLGFYLRSKLNPIAALAGFRPLDICLVIKEFTSCLIQLSFDIIHKPERATKHKCCQNQWLKEEKSSERDITVDVELVLTATPASSSCLQKTRDEKGRDFASVRADGINFQPMLAGCEDWQGFPRAEDPLLRPWYTLIFKVPQKEMLSMRQKQIRITGTINFVMVWSG